MMNDRKIKAAVCCLQAALLLGEKNEHKKIHINRWNKNWFIQRSILFSDCHLLNELKNAEMADFRN
jgi:hypothetical protein